MQRRAARHVKINETEAIDWRIRSRMNLRGPWKVEENAQSYKQASIAKSPIFFLLLLAMAISTAQAQSTSAEWSFAEAVDQHGVVDINFNPWGDIPIDGTISHIKKLAPGLVNRVGFLYGGTSMTFYASLARLLERIRPESPRVMYGGGFNEAIKKDYDAELECGGELGNMHFQARTLANPATAVGDYWMVDPSRPEVQKYYICEGMIQLRLGIHFLHFEAPELVIKASADANSAIRGYEAIVSALRRTAKELQTPVYFSGDVFLAQRIPLSAIYQPSRFFHTTVPEFLSYQNKVQQPSNGVGYTYWLSEKLAQATRQETPKETRILFYVDNWDEGQDDLRRLMELDAENRHSMLVHSALVARKAGAYFVAPLTHCLGCVKPEHLGDQCELGPKGKTGYDADRCADMATILQVLETQRARWP